MLRKIVISTVFFILLFVPKAYPEKNESDEKWYPFVISENLDPNSPTNIGKLVLDAPAGKHGFIKVKDGYFYFEDETQARFWGTNLCFNACFPTKKEAEVIADRIAFFGFNAVRLHHMDFSFEPKGIFKDTNPGKKDPQMKKTGVLSKEQLDKLDYLIYQLKLRGIYIDMNLLVSRHFTKADGVIDADKFGLAAKPASMFDRKLIELQKQYARDLLTHYNPYTKLRYCDDPVVAMTEITNENSILHSWHSDILNGSFFGLKKNSIPIFYSKELDKKWNLWLKEKYVTTTSVDSTRPIYKFRESYKIQTIRDIEEFYTDLDKKYFMEMTDFLKKNIGLKAPVTGSQYASVASQKSCDFIDNHFYWDYPYFPHIAYDETDFTIRNDSMLLDHNLGIIGEAFGTSTIDKPSTITEWNHCYPNQYAYEAPPLIAFYAVKNNFDALFQFTLADSWDKHPAFDNIRSYFDSIANSQQLILCSIGSYIYNLADNLNIDIKDGIYRIESAKIKGVAGFIKDKTVALDFISLKPTQNGAIFLYSAENKPIAESTKLVLAIIGEIKNTGSEWKNGRFNWGHAPVLLKDITDKITITNKNYTIWKLNSEGKHSTDGTTTAWFEIIKK